MAERDPFGRLPDENPLAGLGALSDGTTSQAGEPVVVSAREDWSGGEPAKYSAPAPPPKPKPAAQQWGAPSGASATPAQPRPARPAGDQSLAEVIRQAQSMSGGTMVQSARVIGRLMRLVVLLVVLGVVFGVAKPLVDAAKDIGDSVSAIKTPDDIANSPSSAGEQGSTSSKVPSGLSSNSMLVRRNFDRVLHRLGTSGLGHVRSLTIWPERLTTELLTNGGSQRTVWISSDSPKLDDHGTIGPGFSHQPTVRFSKIDTAAPARLARSAAGRARRPVTQVSYITLSAEQGTVVWRAYLKGGRIYVADAHGRITHRIS
jgi:Sec-independent protein translocase protein TatA